MANDLSSTTVTYPTVTIPTARKIRRRRIFVCSVYFLGTCISGLWLFRSSSVSSNISPYPKSSLSSLPSSSSTTYKKTNDNDGGGKQYIVGGRTTVTVGNQGEHVQRAIRDRLPQRNKGQPRELWDVIEDRRCLKTGSTSTTIDQDSLNLPPSTLSTTTETTTTTTTETSETTIHQSKIHLPDALLIGVQKGGTTALSDYLHKHPQVERNIRKELYFLDEVVDKVMISQYRSSSSSSSSSSSYYDSNKRNKNNQRERKTAINNKENNSTAGGLISTRDDGGGGGIPQQLIQTMYRKAIKSDMKNLYDGRSHRHDHKHNHRERGYDDDEVEDRHHGKMIFDMTPNYIFQSDRLPQRISCILPWAKILVLLRDPIERARSQYDMKIRFVSNTGRSSSKQQRKRGRKPASNIPSFASYIEADIQALRETGVLQDWSVVDFETFFHSQAMKEAWRTYLNSGLNAPVGMSLYAIQIVPFLEFIPREKILVVKSEDLQTRTDQTFNHVLDFLGLQKMSLQAYRTSNKGRGTAIDTKTRTILKTVFEPFNRKLVELLGDEWDCVWETYA
mmetsp:Transcript_26975/g.64391  ORF Transcript_26975/g.64391 Transcript_26975/m.64391 type:complete len:562 (+) Transcript_26975:217-1902(+)